MRRARSWAARVDSTVVSVKAGGVVQIRTLMKDVFLSRLPCATLRQALADSHGTGGMTVPPTPKVTSDTSRDDLKVLRDSVVGRYEPAKRRILIPRSERSVGDTLGVAAYRNGSIIVRQVVCRPASLVEPTSPNGAAGRDRLGQSPERLAPLL